METNTINSSLTEIYSGGGKWLTQNFPTLRREWHRRVLLVDGQEAGLWREADGAEKTAWEAAPPEVPDPDDPATALFIREWEADGMVLAADRRTWLRYSAFNSRTGYFELNGITDITMEEAVRIKAAGRIRNINAQQAYLHAGIRTNLPPLLAGNGYGHPLHINLAEVCGAGMEVLNLVPSGFGRHTPSALSFAEGDGAPDLRRIIGSLSVACLTSVKGAPNLEEADMWELRGNLDISGLPRLSATTVGRLHYLPLSSGSKTVTVHPDVYAKLTDESNTEWHNILMDAMAKNISFATV